MSKKTSVWVPIIVATMIITTLAGITAFLLKSYQNEKAIQKDREEQAEPAAPIIGVFDVQKKIEADDSMTIIDLRAAEDYKAQHIVGAINIPIDEFREGAYKSLPINKDLILMCYGVGCEFSTEAAEILKNKGYEKMYNMRAGITGWAKAELPLIEGLNKEDASSQYKVALITVDQAKEMINDPDKTTTIIDVRSRTNYQQEHIKNSISIPLEELEQKRNTIPRGTTIIIVSNKGPKGSEASALLYDLGHLNVLNIDGGYTEWAAVQKAETEKEVTEEEKEESAS